MRLDLVGPPSPATSPPPSPSCYCSHLNLSCHCSSSHLPCYCSPPTLQPQDFIATLRPPPRRYCAAAAAPAGAKLSRCAINCGQQISGCCPNSSISRSSTSRSNYCRIRISSHQPEGRCTVSRETFIVRGGHQDRAVCQTPVVGTQQMQPQGQPVGIGSMLPVPALGLPV